MGTHMRVLSESYLMNTSMIGFRWLSKLLHPCASEKEALVLEGLTHAIHSNGSGCEGPSYVYSEWLQISFLHYGKRYSGSFAYS